LKAKINELAKYFANDEDCVELILDMVNSCAEYVQIVSDMESTNAILSTKDIVNAGVISKDSLNQINDLDRNRTDVHNAMIASVNSVNRLCELEGLPLIYTGDSQRRHYGDFAQEVVNSYFNDRL